MVDIRLELMDIRKNNALYLVEWFSMTCKIIMFIIMLICTINVTLSQNFTSQLSASECPFVVHYNSSHKKPDTKHHPHALSQSNSYT